MKTLADVRTQILVNESLIRLRDLGVPLKDGCRAVGPLSVGMVVLVVRRKHTTDMLITTAGTPFSEALSFFRL